ncbi:CAP domain-containing protein [Aerococcus sp. UMB8608]|uniref:CAP domain-containing protein n=1 Tax=Aerococcus sp. UMB8608 TaxID=3046347 RepID=UPI00254E5255|nr:CAP domain-containing protein [Aerococcus sp. UMB8608]MDK6680039.1 CAP domain-containing protein [Aerococcus sp. UMB8608]
MKLDKKLLIALGLIGAGSLGVSETVQADDFDDDFDDYEAYESDDDWDDYDAYDDDDDDYDDDWDDYDSYDDDYDDYDDDWDDDDDVYSEASNAYDVNFVAYDNASASDDVYDEDWDDDAYAANDESYAIPADWEDDDFNDLDDDQDDDDDDFDDLDDDQDDDDDDFDDLDDDQDDDDDDDFDDLDDDQDDQLKSSRPIPVEKPIALPSDQTVDPTQLKAKESLIPTAEAASQKTDAKRPEAKQEQPGKPSADGVTLANQSTTSLSQAISKHFHDLVNQERAQQGLAPLAYQDSYQLAADTRTQEIIDSFSHTRPNGQAFYTANGFEATGGYVGENIQQTYASPGTSPEAIAQELFNNWKNSPGHYANMIDANYKGQSLGLEFIDNGDHTLIYSAQILGQ